MKKTTLCLAGLLMLAFLFTDCVYAQEQEFSKGDIDLNVGLGFGAPKVTGGTSTLFPTITATGDYALRDDWGPGVFGIGAYIGTSFYKWDASVLGTTWGVRYVDVVIASRATYHYTFVENLDTYAGIILGLNIVTASPYGGYTGNTEAGVDVAADIFAGAKYYFSDSFAAYSELSPGISGMPIFTIGAAFKL